MSQVSHCGKKEMHAKCAMQETLDPTSRNWCASLALDCFFAASTHKGQWHFLELRPLIPFVRVPHS